MELQNSDGEKDIGVLVDDQLNYSQHIQQKINKTNSIMGLIRRTFTYPNEHNFKYLLDHILNTAQLFDRHTSSMTLTA